MESSKETFMMDDEEDPQSANRICLMDNLHSFSTSNLVRNTFLKIILRRKYHVHIFFGRFWSRYEIQSSNYDLF